MRALLVLVHRRRKRGKGEGGRGGGQAPNNLIGGGGQHTLWPPQ